VGVGRVIAVWLEVEPWVIGKVMLKGQAVERRGGVCVKPYWGCWVWGLCVCLGVVEGACVRD
jgi:hypothetical protein